MSHARQAGVGNPEEFILSDEFGPYMAQLLTPPTLLNSAVSPCSVSLERDDWCRRAPDVISGVSGGGETGSALCV